MTVKKNWGGNMSFLIFFDETNKLDQPNKEYSYYGALGGTEETFNSMNQHIQHLLYELSSASEFHFSEFKNDSNVKKYFQALHYVIQQDIRVKVFIVNNQLAKTIADEMNVTLVDLRNLFYVKIPERLFYGMTRDLELPAGAEINIGLDYSTEYEQLKLSDKIKEQMNAHSVYRNKRYKISSVKSMDSKTSIPLQMIDILMGVVVFLKEKHYLRNTNSAIVKSDFIYRILSEGNNIQLFQNKIQLFNWEGLEHLPDLKISQYIAEFMVYKANYDLKEIIKLQQILATQENYSLQQIRKSMNYSNKFQKQLIGYLDQIKGKGRNYYLLNDLK